ncbi:MAG: class GN sortase [Azospirillaceae bacterium]
MGGGWWRRWPLWVAAPLFALGGWQIGAAVAIEAKASLAQYLLQRARDRTLSGEAEVRPWPWADTWPVARLSVPERGVDLIVLAGGHGEALAFGPGLLPQSSPTGGPGLTIISGHRDTHFRFLAELEPGDGVMLETADGLSQSFTVGGSVVVDYRDVSLAVPRDGRMLTLVTCYPFDALDPGGPERYLVSAMAN